MGFGAITHRRRRGLRRAASRRWHGVAALRRHRRSPRRHRHRRRAAARSPAPRTSGGTRPTRSTPTAGGFPSSDSRSSVSPGAAVGPRRVHGAGQRHVRYAAERLQDPRERSVRRRGRRRTGERLAGAARHGAERRYRRGVAAARDHRHRAHRADAAGRRRAHVPVPRQLARPVRAAVRAASLAVHDRRRQRIDSHRRGTGRLRPPAGGRHGRHARPAPVRLRAEERGADPDRARSSST